MSELFAYIACTILALVALFQLALVTGAPLGKFAWGGGHTVLPAKLRIGSITSIILYGIFAVIILNKAGVIHVISSQSLANAAMWVLTAYMSVGVLMNAISRSKPERSLMTPVALILAILCLYIALN